MFQDHAVVQRAKPIRVWGRAEPGMAVTVSLGEVSALASAGAEGRWEATLPAMAAGGPFTLDVRAKHGAKQTVKDVLIGDVFLCSGQSNMVLQIKRTLDSRSEIENAKNDTIRMLTVPTGSNPVPVSTFAQNAIAWQTTTPANVPEFSATCFYFARELQKTLKVPIGLINASWGGSDIRTWMSQEAIHAAGGNDRALDVVRLYASDKPAAAKVWGAIWQDWWKEKAAGPAGVEPWSAWLPTQDWRPVPSLGFWDNWGEPKLVNYVGTVWYRTSVVLTEEQAAQGATLNLGAVDEVDETWVNGIAVGGGSGGDRTYDLPSGTLHVGDNTIAVSVLNTYKFGGLIGPSAKQALRFTRGATAPLAGPWAYKIDVPMSKARPPRAPWEPIAGLAMAYNAMIAPIGPFGLRGVVWYQGESNTSESATYQSLLAGLMADWRGIFGTDLPFLIVQLSGFGPAPTAPGPSGWAELREAERLAVAQDGHAGLAVTIDIGERYDVHPANKQELGRRLTRAARHVVYGEAIAPSGPVAKTARAEKGGVRVSFGDVEGTLVAYGADGPIGFQLCGPDQDTCHYAVAHLDGSDVLLTAAAHPAPTRVRYCWADDPVCTLFDRGGLPAGPFELAIGISSGSAKPALKRSHRTAHRRH
jgi:sialate O-acetylesterase